MHIDEEKARRELGTRLQQARTAAREGRGYTQAEVGAELNRGAKAVSAWEAGRGLPDALALGWMAQHYGVSADELLGLVPSGGGNPWRTAAQEVAEIAGPTELPLGVFIRIIDHASRINPEDERERRAFVNGLITAFNVKDETRP